MRYRRLQTLWFAALLVTFTVIHCLPTETRADRRRSTTFLAASSQDSWPEWDGVTSHPELTDAYPITGWPREYGRLCVTFTSGAAGEHRAIIDGRTDGEDPRPYLSVVDDGRIRFGIQTVGSIAGGEIIPFHTHTACVDRTLGITTLILDGQIIGTSSTLPAWDWHPTARLGSRYGGADPLGGVIKSIQWRGLRLACDMRSDTCSDGRKITTVRASPVPCEVSPGVWEMVPENTGCYSVRGLEAWNSNTSYLAYGAELDREPWTPVRGGTVEKLPDGWRVKNDPNQNHSGVDQVLTGAASGEVWTSAYILRTSTDVFFQLWAGASQSCGGAFVLNTGGAWRQFSCSTVVPATPMAAIYPGGTVGSTPRPQYSIDVKAAWTVKSDTPGRPCWGGEAPVTCAEDRHTISTEGWQPKNWEISLVYTPQGDTTSADMYMVYTSGLNLYRIYESGALGFSVRWGNKLSVQSTNGLVWENGHPYHIRVRWSPERAEIWRDGVLLHSWVPTIIPDSLFEPVYIGSPSSAGGRRAQGSIRDLRIRSYEEVSP